MQHRRDEFVKPVELVAPTIDFWHPFPYLTVGTSASGLRSQALKCRIRHPMQDQGGARSGE